MVMRELNPISKEMKLQLQKEDTASKARKKRELQMEMLGKEGSIAETDDEKMKASILAKLPEVLKKIPDKTSMLLLSIVRKDLEVRSKEPKIPWQQCKVREIGTSLKVLEAEQKRQKPVGQL